jgi:hypothetical protein
MAQYRRTSAPTLAAGAQGMDSKAELRRELEDAIAKVKRQLEIDATPSAMPRILGGPPDMRGVVGELQSELARLQEALAGLGSGDD